MKNLTLGKNFWNKNKFTQSCRKSPAVIFLNKNEECLSLKSIKVQFWDLAVLILSLISKRNLERHFPGFVWSVFKKPAKKVEF